MDGRVGERMGGGQGRRGVRSPAATGAAGGAKCKVQALAVHHFTHRVYGYRSAVRVLQLGAPHQRALMGAICVCVGCLHVGNPRSRTRDPPQTIPTPKLRGGRNSRRQQGMLSTDNESHPTAQPPNHPVTILQVFEPKGTAKEFGCSSVVDRMRRPTNGAAVAAAIGGKKNGCSKSQPRCVAPPRAPCPSRVCGLGLCTKAAVRAS